MVAEQPGGTPSVPGTGHVDDVVGPDPLVIRDAATGAAVPDAFQRLWNPHRMAYIDAGREGKGRGHEDDCPFCEAPQKSDEDALIVARGEHAYVLLNLFPYNNGHLLVCPYRHVPLYDEATPDETREMAELTQTAMRVLRAVSHCDGFNIGMNQGEIAGAGCGRAPAPARRPAVGLGLELLPDHRPDEVDVPAAGGHPPTRRGGWPTAH